MTYSSYRYEIGLTWINEDQDIAIDSNRITTMVIDYSYRKQNMPLIFCTIQVSKNLADDIILNKATSKFYLSVNKYIDDGIINKEEYIRGEFVYLIPNDINYNKSLDYQDTRNPDSSVEDEFREIIVGLFNVDFINRNRYSINTVYKDVTKTDIIMLNARHCNLLMEPIQNDITFDQLLIPSINSLSKLIEYIDSRSSIYSTPYLFFMDLDGTTYLLSTSGKVVESINDEISNVNIRINDPSNNISNTQGIIKDRDSDTYILDINATNTKVTKKTTQDKLFNRLTGIDSEGVKTTIDLSVFSDPSIKDTDEFVYVPNGNSGKLEHMAKKIERSEIKISIAKNDIDGSVFTPNKSYYIRNYDSYSDLDGNYNIVDKKEVFKRESDYFRISFVASFEKL